MKIVIFFDDTKTFQIYNLPKIIDGNYWVTYQDEDGNKKNFLNVYAYNNQWVYEDDHKQIVILPFRYYKVKETFFYTIPLYDESLKLYSVQGLDTLSFGKSKGDIQADCFGEATITLNKKGNRWLIQCDKANFRMYINQKIVTGKLLEPTDSIFLNGMTLYVLAEYLIFNNPQNIVHIENSKIVLKEIPSIEETTETLDDKSIYEKKDYFYRSPRFRNVIEEVQIKIDSPPASPVKEEMPFLLQMGGMLTMGMSSMVTLFVSVSGLASGERDFMSVLPSLVIGVSMLVGMLLIPTLSRRYQKKKSLEQEKLRQEKYLEYLAAKKKEIHQVIEDQQTRLNDNSVSLETCEDIILHRRRNLWERKIEHDDFLSVHIGIGEIPAKIKISFPEEHFSLEDDNLKNELFKMADEPRNLKNVPINVSFVEKNICAILGNIQLIPSFLNSILLQFITFHSYEDVKFVLLTSEATSSKWEDMKEIPYLWNNDRTMRYYGETKEDKFAILNTLFEVYKNRRYADEDYSKESGNDYRSFLPYYVIITDDFESIRDSDFVRAVMKNKTNFGFSFLIITHRLMGLPNECNSFINVDANQSGMIENELSSDKQLVFQAEFLNKPLTDCYRMISNIPIPLASAKGRLPDTISFLEMYNVGRVEQLNALNRWNTNHPYDTLEAPVGVDSNGSLFMLDLHEKAHGPHGLVAGMTGSGKSEFIITYILSMAVNYHPDMVSFVLIDYKGGGLAGAFYNPDTGVRLPHLAGTITNLDTVEIKRSLASIESELKRRQRLFNEARQQTNESTMNIYKYQKLYQEGVVKEPIPHLFIISDEFAELKSQQPEFMAQLISTARIGRSLGVHLILATQKPSGVVDAQIWSNSKFRVCLKVQDRSDSMDMIKVPDAAALTDVGRFYLQVGYNEFFALGQSAWCGAPYYEMDERKSKVNSSLDYINNVGKVLKSIEQEDVSKKLQYKGEELPAILKYLSDLADKLHLKPSTLWLPSIPEVIYVDNLASKYHYEVKPYVLDEIVGEYDSPSTQSQGLLTLPISAEGNVLIYGSAGSGKENFLTTFLYTAMAHHSSLEVNFYILDFGAETLNIFARAPHVGDVILSDQDDKIVNLFKMLNQMIDDRKKKFMQFGGNYNSYILKSEEKLPNVVVIINNYDNFKELYPDYDEELVSITREASKFGIYFILSVVGSNSVRLKLQQNFKQLLTLQMNNVDDYNTVLGNVRKMTPSKKFGRGLIRLNGNIYEFQTAYALEKDNLSSLLSDFVDRLIENEKTKALKVPVLPDHVYYKNLGVLSTLRQVVVGVEKNSLDVATYNYESRPIHVITGLELEKMLPFLKGMMESFSSIHNQLLFVLDGEKLFAKTDVKTNYFYQKNFDKVLKSASEYILKLDEDYQKYKDDERVKSYTHLTLFIIGVDSFLSQINASLQSFEEMIEKGSALDKISVILVDAADVIKKHDFDSWYKRFNSNSQGIWVGYGLTDQYVIKLSRTPKFCYEEISNKFGYVVRNGIPIQIKLLEGEDNHE